MWRGRGLLHESAAGPDSRCGALISVSQSHMFTLGSDWWPISMCVRFIIVIIIIIIVIIIIIIIIINSSSSSSSSIFILALFVKSIAVTLY